jgi:hypothetical protein
MGSQMRTPDLYAGHHVDKQVSWHFMPRLRSTSSPGWEAALRVGWLHPQLWVRPKHDDWLLDLLCMASGEGSAAGQHRSSQRMLGGLRLKSRPRDR